MTRRVSPALAVGTILLAAGAFTACESERAIVFEPVGPPIFDFLVAPGRLNLPSGTTVGQSQLFLSSTTSDLGGGADFNLRLVPQTRTPGAWMAPSEAETEFNVTVAPGATEISYAFSDPGAPGRDGFVGTYTTVFNVTAHTPDTLIFARLVAARVDAAGAVQATGPVPNEQRIVATGPRQFTFNNLNLGPWNPGDRLRLEFHLRNSSLVDPDSITIVTARHAVTRPTRALTLTLSSLPALASGEVYNFWLVGRDNQGLDVATSAFGALDEFFSKVQTDANGDTLRDAIGNPLLTIDSTDISAVPVNAYAGSSDSAVSWLRVAIDSAGDGGTPVSYHAILVTREAPGATQPGSVRFLWHRTGLVRTDTSATLLFGTYGGTDVVNVVSPQDYVYNPAGAGTGGARGSEVSIDLLEVARPPVGFFYRGYLVDLDGFGVLVDTLRSGWSEDSTVSRVSLYDADVNDLLPSVVERRIHNAQIRNCASGAGVFGCQNTMALPTDNTFAGLVGFQLKLEPKGASSITNGLISHSGVLPEEVQ